jgi:hypothetical protein
MAMDGKLLLTLGARTLDSSLCCFWRKFEEAQMPKFVFTWLAVILMVTSLNAQTDRDQSTDQEVRRIYSYDNMPPRQLIDCPTAATLPRASFDFKMRTTSNGGLIAHTGIGLHRKFMLGVSFGGEQILGEGKATWQDNIAFQTKYQLISETTLLPAIAIGYDGQGYGQYFSDLKRYKYKSKGFYAVASKGYQTYQWSSGLHAGINYSLESDVDKDDDMTFFLGADLSLQNDISLVAEYDLALNDNKYDKANLNSVTERSGKGWGYFNVGIRWIFSERLELGLDLENLFENRADVNSFTRGLRITYLEFF